jgi:hypothetical protein
MLGISVRMAIKEFCHIGCFTKDGTADIVILLWGGTVIIRYLCECLLAMTCISSIMITQNISASSPGFIPLLMILPTK